MKKSRSRWFYALLILFSVFFIVSCAIGFAACGGGKTEVESVTVTSSISIEEGKTGTITASVKMSDDSVYNGSYSWSSSNTSVATVSGSGSSATVTAVKEGSATVTVAVDNDKSATCSVTVTAATPAAPTVTSVTLSESALSLYVDGTSELTATVTMSDNTTSTTQTVSWTSSDASVATVSETGNTATVTAKKAGSATITASVGTVKAECAVTVSDASVESVVISPASLALDTVSAKTGSLTATVTMDDGSSYTGSYAWTSSDTNVATIGTSGTATKTVTAKGAGTTNVTVEAGGVTSEACVVTVTDSVSGISLASKLDLGLNEGSKTDTLTATVNMGSGATGSGEVTWSVADVEDEEGGVADNPAETALADGASTSTVISIVADAQDPNTITVTASAAGKATITASYNDGEKDYSATCDVTVYEDLFVYEAEDAMLFNSPDSTMTSTTAIGTEQTTLGDGTVITNVKNFNTKGDKIVFEVLASAAVTDATIDVIACNGATFGGTFGDNDKILTVNGGEPIALAGTLTNTMFDWTSYGTLTGTISLDAGINYIEITAASTASAGYLNVDKIEIEWIGDEAEVNAISDGTAPTISKVDGVAGNVASVSSGAANSLALSDAYLANKKGSTSSDTFMAVDSTSGAITNITAGDEVVYQISSDAAVSAILALTLGTGESASNLTVKVNGKAVTADATDGTYTISLSKGVNYVELVAACGLSGSLSLGSATLTTVAAEVEEARVSAAKAGDADFAVDGVTFTDSRITVTYDPETRTYTLDGTSAVLSSEQLAALELDGEDDDHEGCEYIAFKVAANAGETVKITNYNGDTPTEGKSWTLYGAGVTGTSTTDGAFVLDTTDHIDGDFKLVLEVTYENGVTMTYTIVLGTIERSAEEDRVVAAEAGDERLNGSTTGVAFDATDITVTYDPEEKTYTVSGTSAVMGETLAGDFWGSENASAHAECEYITFVVNANAGETITIKSYNGENVAGTWTLYGTETGDNVSTTDGLFILDTTDHTDGDFKLVLEVTYENGDNVTYTIVLGTIERAHQEAENARVDAPKDGDDDFSVTFTDENDEQVTVTFTDSDITVSYDPSTRTYTIEGVSAKYSAEQLAAMQLDGEGDDHTGCWYVSFKVSANAGETIVITNYNGDTPTEGKSWVMYGAGVSGQSTTDGAFVLDTTDHITGDFKLVLEVTYQNGDKVTYTIVLGTIETYCERYGHIATEYSDRTLYAVYRETDSAWCYLCETCGEWIELGTCGDDYCIYDFVLVAKDETSLDAAIATAKERTFDDDAVTVTQILVYGTIQISESGIVTIDCSNVEIYGLGADNSKIVDSKYDASEHSGLAKSGVEITGSNVTIRDLTIDGTALNELASTVQYSHAVDILDGASNVTLSNCVIVGGGTGNNDAAVCVSTVAGDVTIENCTISGARNGVEIEHTGANGSVDIVVTISGGSIEGERGIFISGDDGGHVTLKVENATVNGQNCFTFGSVVMFTGCTFGYYYKESTAYGSVYTFRDMTFVNCTFLSHTAGTTNADSIYNSSLNYVIGPSSKNILLTFIGCEFVNTYTDTELETGKLDVNENTFIYLVSGQSDVADCYLYFDGSVDATKYIYNVTNHTVTEYVDAEPDDENPADGDDGGNDGD